MGSSRHILIRAHRPTDWLLSSAIRQPAAWVKVGGLSGTRNMSRPATKSIVASMHPPRSPVGSPFPVERHSYLVPTTTSPDADLVFDLEEMASADKWNFEPWAARDFSHGLFQYPAMMVPQMQRELLLRMRDTDGAAKLYDPFVGSGTTMAEAMMLGMDFLGTDINPLAVLLCRAKSGPFHIDALTKSIDRVSTSARADTRRQIELDWTGWRKWFRQDIAIQLSRIRRAIRSEPTRATRRFLWVCLAETVRLSSNSRTSTVKLHTRPEKQIRERQNNVLDLFDRHCKRNLERFKDHRDALRDAGLLVQGHYTGEIEIVLHDVVSGSAPNSASSCQILLSSPPYGDNATTVPYGQQAFLPLQWIDKSDVDGSFGEEFLATTHAIDSMSLGAPTRGALGQVDGLRAISPSLDRTLETLSTLPPDRARRVAAFWRDFDTALTNILATVDEAALTAWTVGNRSVGGLRVPMDAILTELLEHRGATKLTSLARTIPDCRKRQASRNSVAETMGAEQVLVMRGRAPDGF